MNLGLRPFCVSIVTQIPTLIKRDLLYFDQVQLCTQQISSVFEDIEGWNPEYAADLQYEFDYLKKLDLITELDLSKMILSSLTEKEFMGRRFNTNDEEELHKIVESYHAIPDTLDPREFKEDATELEMFNIILENAKSIRIAETEATRVAAVFLNRFSLNDNVTAILEESIPTDLPNFKSMKVLEVVLDKMPTPDESVSWEQIIEYRADPDSSAKFAALKVWMQDVATKDLSKNEISERIEHLLNENKKHMRLHKMKYHNSTNSILISTPFEILEKLVKFEWSSLAKKFFNLKEKHFDLMEAELNAPGRELAYIIKTAERFG